MDIRGEWFNELGSMMRIDVNGSTITGKYHTAVGDAEGVYDLIGRISIPSDDNRTLGFVVTWQNDKRSTDSATAWSGEAQEVDGTQHIATTWLLTEETAPADNWKSTIVGKDLFSRLPPDPRSVSRLRAFRRPSHHSAA
jgi:hypothetical protein